MLKTSAICITALLLSLAVSAQNGSYGHRDTNVNGYYKQDGGYVQPHQRSAPNNTQTDNYNSQGNYNPNNGQQGTRQPRY